MLFRGALGVALLAAPLAAVAGQSSLQRDPSTAASADSSSGRRFVWIAAGATGAAFFTTVARLSERRASITAERGMLPSAPVPNRYADGSLTPSGPSAGEGTPAPGQTQPPDQNTSLPGSDQSQQSHDVSGDQGMSLLTDLPLPPPPDLTEKVDTTSTPTGPVGPVGGSQTTEQQQPPPVLDQPATVDDVTAAPEPDGILLLGTGLIALIPTARRRWS